MPAANTMPGRAIVVGVISDTHGLLRPQAVGALRGSDIIIHAAGTKYVDLGEMYPNECVDVNVRGSQNVARAAMDKGVGLVIGISTDKACPPCKSLYGTTKSVMEKLFVLLNSKSETRFICLRFGNIAWSTGSVFPIWKSMLTTNGKISSTGMDMRRFYFTVHEASQMIIDGINNEELLHGKILAKKMKSVQIGDVLSRFISIYGGDYERSKQRVGESIDETMIGESEIPHTRHFDVGPNAYYLIDYAKDGLSEVNKAVDTRNSGRLSETEIDNLIQPPVNSYI